MLLLHNQKVSGISPDYNQHHFVNIVLAVSGHLKIVNQNFYRRPGHPHAPSPAAKDQENLTDKVAHITFIFLIPSLSSDPAVSALQPHRQGTTMYPLLFRLVWRR